VKRLIQSQKDPAGGDPAPPDEIAFLQAVVDAIPGIFYVVDERGYFVRWNRAAQELVGVADERMPHKKVLDAICDEDHPLIAGMMREALAKGYAEAEARSPLSSGEVRWRFLTARRVEIAGRPYLIGTGLDVTERRKLEQELERQARTDFLTGISNRRHFLDLADQELARVRRYGRPFSILMLDLDLFKNVNDRYGHRVGDLTLQKVVEVCQQILREVDVIGRLGGEEFGIILPETEAEQAVQVADRVRQAIAAASVRLPQGGSVGITTSIGVATYSDEDVDVDAVINRADRALYEAKRSGRDRVSMERKSRSA
jgi:diguanylate cyclase (GGDEF)-like protein/PAS domain S-box-containing protein